MWVVRLFVFSLKEGTRSPVFVFGVLLYLLLTTGVVSQHCSLTPASSGGCSSLGSVTYLMVVSGEVKRASKSVAHVHMF